MNTDTQVMEIAQRLVRQRQEAVGRAIKLIMSNKEDNQS